MRLTNRVAQRWSGWVVGLCLFAAAPAAHAMGQSGGAFFPPNGPTTNGSGGNSSYCGVFQDWYSNPAGFLAYDVNQTVTVTCLASPVPIHIFANSTLTVGSTSTTTNCSAFGYCKTAPADLNQAALSILGGSVDVTLFLPAGGPDIWAGNTSFCTAVTAYQLQCHGTATIISGSNGTQSYT